MQLCTGVSIHNRYVMLVTFRTLEIIIPYFPVYKLGFEYRPVVIESRVPQQIEEIKAGLVQKQDFSIFPSL